MKLRGTEDTQSQNVQGNVNNSPFLSHLVSCKRLAPGTFITQDNCCARSGFMTLWVLVLRLDGEPRRLDEPELREPRLAWMALDVGAFSSLRTATHEPIASVFCALHDVAICSGPIDSRSHR